MFLIIAYDNNAKENIDRCATTLILWYPVTPSIVMKLGQLKFSLWSVTIIRQTHTLEQCLPVVNPAHRIKQQFNLNKNWSVVFLENAHENVGHFVRVPRLLTWINLNPRMDK